MSDKAGVYLSRHLRKKLPTIATPVGFIGGYFKDGVRTCIECGMSPLHFLSGLDVLGFFCTIAKPDLLPKDLLSICEELLVDKFSVDEHFQADDDGNVLVLFICNSIFDGKTETNIKAYCYSSYYRRLDNITLFEEDGDLSTAHLFRATGHMPLIFEGSTDKDVQKENLELAMEKLKTIFQSRIPVFYSRNMNAFLKCSEAEDSKLSVRCKDFLKGVTEKLSQGSSRKSKKKDAEKIPFTLEILLQTTGQVALENNVNHSLVIHCQRRNFLCVTCQLPIDVLVIAHDSDTLSNLYDRLVVAITSQLEKFNQCLLTFCKNSKFITPEVYHFYPYGWDFPLNIIYPLELSDEELEQVRREIHKDLILPVDRPLFRKINRHIFPEEGHIIKYLINPHVGLSPSGVENGTTAIVYGKYAYHHYKQDYVNDDGWGCAYRSLQTIVSWFHLQGYTDKAIPTHKEIQQALVDIGDKQSSFVNSTQWIGSQEVSFCLDHLIGVTSKIMFVSSGAEMASIGRELLHHFQNQGTPVMIGGGVLAHTILGVDFNKDTGDVKFLILDPHYTGGEDLAIIQNKGWCGWKSTQFWDQTSFYNLCLPQRPIAI